MSVKVITAVLRLVPVVVTPSERLVLYALAWHADDHGLNAWPAVATIARETSLTPRAVQKVLRRLNAKGLVFVQALAARGSVRYGVDLQVLDRERYSQSGQVETPTTANQVQGTANQVHPTANVVHPTANQVHPIRPLTVHEPSEKKNLAATPRVAPSDFNSDRGRATALSAPEREPGDPLRDPMVESDIGTFDRAFGRVVGAFAKKLPPGELDADDADDERVPPSAADLARLAHNTFDALGDDAPFDALATDFLRRLAGGNLMGVADNVGAILFSVRKARLAARGITFSGNGRCR